MSAYTIGSGGSLTEGIRVYQGRYHSSVGIGMLRGPNGLEPSYIGLDDRDFGREVEIVFEAHPVWMHSAAGSFWRLRQKLYGDQKALVLIDINPGLGGRVEVTSAEQAELFCPDQGKKVPYSGRCRCGERVDNRIHPNSGVVQGRRILSDADGVTILGGGMRKFCPEEGSRYVLYPSFMLELEPGASLRVWQGGQNACIFFIHWDGEDLRVGSPSEVFLAEKPEEAEKKPVGDALI